MLSQEARNMPVTFTTVVQKAEGINATGIHVPAEAVAALGTQKRPKVKVSVNGYTYRSTVAPYGNVFMLPLNQEHRAAAGVEAGEEVEVTLELDTEPRTVDIPDELRTALASKAGALEAFEALSYTNRKEAVRQVTEAKAQETRDRRIANIVSQLGSNE
jgi:Domain of unknown function (DUF1905)/Bacteriocin-protection, YdeI or OmpD-Associated